MTQLTYITDVWIITCVVSAATKQSRKMLLAARNMGSRAALGWHARGFGARERFGALGVAVETDKEVIQVLVASEQRDLVFEAMYKAGELDRVGAGFMYMTPLEKMAAYVPESILERVRAEGESGEGP
jgi:nitrogen regulatory protein PII